MMPGVCALAVVRANLKVALTKPVLPQLYCLRRQKQLTHHTEAVPRGLTFASISRE